MIKETIIYALCDPNSEEIRYVGQTSDSLSGRLSQHIWAAKRTNKTFAHKWINSLLKQSLRPKIIVLESNAVWNESEIRWIAKLRAKSYRLTNHSDGGDGTVGYQHTEETKTKISQALKGNKNGLGRQWTPDESFKEGCRERNLGEKNPHFGKPRPEDTRSKIRESQPNSRRVLCVDTGEVFASLNEAGRVKGVAYQNIRSVCEGKRNKAGKLTWSYK